MNTKKHVIEMLISHLPAADEAENKIISAFTYATNLSSSFGRDSALAAANGLVDDLVAKRQSAQKMMQEHAALLSDEETPASEPERKRFLDRIHPVNSEPERFIKTLAAAISAAALVA